MGIEAVIRLPDQFAIEALPAHACFVPGYEQDRLALDIKSEGHSPFAAGRAETQLLHVRVSGAVQCVNAGPSQLRPKLLEKARQSQNLQLNLRRQSVKLRLKRIANLDNLVHVHSMASAPYGVKSMSGLAGGNDWG
jgi:hypothetical protein